MDSRNNPTTKIVDNSNGNQINGNVRNDTQINPDSPNVNNDGEIFSTTIRRKKCRFRDCCRYQNNCRYWHERNTIFKQKDNSQENMETIDQHLQEATENYLKKDQRTNENSKSMYKKGHWTM